MLRKFFLICLILQFLFPCFSSASEKKMPKNFHKTTSSVLKPVYKPLAAEIVNKFSLADKKGIAIDLGSGPGDLIIELCRLTENLHWINADINPGYFPRFIKNADNAGFGNRVSAIYADAKDLPLKTDYADIIVSRGSFHLWGDFKAGLSEVHRVLKPGGTAYIGRGFSSDLPVETARDIRTKQKKNNGGLKYDVNKTAENMKSIMKELNIKDYKIIIPQPPGAADINYGIWLEFHKN